MEESIAYKSQREQEQVAAGWRQREMSVALTPFGLL